MAAVFYTSTTGSSLFKGDFAVAPSIRIPFLDTVLGENGYLIINTVAAEHRDTIQFFLTFDDVINWFFFGYGLGSLTIGGMLLTPCSTDSGQSDGLTNFYSVVNANRGKELDVSLGGQAFKAVISSFSTTASSDPELIIQFQINLAIVKQPGLSTVKFDSDC